MTSITFEQIKTAIESLAAKAPDNKYVPPPIGEGGRLGYPTCFYTRGQCLDGSIGCIVGQAIGSLGIDMARFDAQDDSTSAYDALRTLGIDCSYDDLSWITRVQSVQDANGTWSSAVMYANSRVMEVCDD